MDTYYVELVQTDPPDSPTPGCGHYAGEISGFATATEALVAGLPIIGRPVPKGHFFPCCDWQAQDTIVTACLVGKRDEQGNSTDTVEVQARLKRNNG